GLDLAIPRGCVAGLLGPNGSGKSTTIRLLLGLHSPTAGEARVLGHPAGHPEARRRTGYMPEEADLYPFLTARESVETAAALHGMPRAGRREAADRMLERVGLAAEAKRRVEGFSRGMKRRVALAQALVHGPELLVLDEPTAGLDPVGRDGLLALLEECRGKGVTVLLSSHVLSDVERLCDRVAILGSGRLAAEGTLAEVLERKAVTALEVEGPEAAVRAAREAAERAGGKVVSAQPAREPLERVFLRLLGRDRGAPKP
ncbi:MAG TPA: ABC transporter ATP-binding protein, partial [Planctomycetota bacterium]|nr:ABC transporter ATP-binding protein [Planctomycetota bacterium]